MTAKPGSVNRASKWRGEDDFYPTPSGATLALCNLGILPTDVWEPACGDGAMSRVLESAGHRVVSTNLTDRGYGIHGVDFLKCDELAAPAIVTNPPFGIADDFIAHALSLQPSVACFFLRLKYLEGAKRFSRIFSKGGLAAVHVFVERVKFFAGGIAVADQPGWNTEAFAWFVWRAGHNGRPEIGWVSRDGSVK